MDIIIPTVEIRFVLGDPLTKDDPLRPIYGPEADDGTRPLVGYVLRVHAALVLDALNSDGHA